MTRRDDLRARAARAANRTPAADPGEAQRDPGPLSPPHDQAPPPRAAARPGRPASIAPRTKPVRMTVDLSPLAHERLRARRNALRESLGMAADLPGAVVVRALLAELDANSGLADAVRDRIAEDPTGYGRQ